MNEYKPSKIDWGFSYIGENWPQERIIYQVGFLMGIDGTILGSQIIVYDRYIRG